MRTPLAWLNTTSSTTKLVLAGSGIGFAVILMFMQIGFLNGLFDSTVQLLRMLKADLVVISRSRYTLPSEDKFSLSLLKRAMSNSEVVSAIPMYIDRSQAEVRVIGRPSRAIRAIGLPMGSQVFVDPDLNERFSQLHEVDEALVDRRSKHQYGFEMTNLEQLRAQEVELSGKHLRLADWVNIGTDFVYDGSLVLTDRSVEHFFPFRNFGREPLQGVDLGLIELTKGADMKLVARDLQVMFGDEVSVYSREALIQREINFWATSTPIGIIFSIGTVMGLLVGVIICYQILSTDIQDHLPEFATLKAMGYGSTFFLRFILEQSFYLCLIGFIPGLVVSLALYWGLSYLTGLVMVLNAYRIGMVFLLAFVMCVTSGMLAVRKLWAADPATLFK